MRKILKIIFCSVSLLFFCHAQAGDSHIKKFMTYQEHLPTLSPDKQWIAFIHRKKMVLSDDCKDNPYMDDSLVDQLWVYNVKTQKKKLLVNYNFFCDVPEKMILHIEDIKFSPDSKIIYFQTGAWLHSDAIHAVNIDGSREHYLIPGDSLEIIQKGDSKGDLVVSQSRYFIEGGSFDWYWLYTPSGKQEGPIGEDFGKEQRKAIEDVT